MHLVNWHRNSWHRNSNRDVFWFAPDTVIMDAQNVDLLFYGGAPLTDGDAIAFSTLLQASNGGVKTSANDAFIVKNYDISQNVSGWGFKQFSISNNGKLGLSPDTCQAPAALAVNDNEAWHTVAFIEEMAA